jgi:hypothetical protein
MRTNKPFFATDFTDFHRFFLKSAQIREIRGYGLDLTFPLKTVEIDFLRDLCELCGSILRFV